MQKYKVNLFDDNGMYVDPITYQNKSPKYFDFIYKQEEFDGITLFTDLCALNDISNIKSKYKIAWLLEPKSISPHIYQLYKTPEKFDYILTYEEQLLSLGEKYKFTPVGCCWIPQESIKIHDKTKLVSCIMSNKALLPGHRLRHQSYFVLQNKIDFYGNNFVKIPTKEIALNDYMFSLCIENSQIINYFTEKLIDCFATGTVPIYYGAQNIDKFFNKEGMIIVNDIMDIQNAINNISKERYIEMKPAIEDNFKRCLQYVSIEDWIHENIFSKLQE